MTSTGGPPRFRLLTFGGVALVGAVAGEEIGGPGPQRRRLALLAVLAASGKRGRTRDQLLGLFWPETTQERARHSLEQALYAMRGALDPGIFLGINPVRLNPGVISSDVADFEAALSRRDPAAAVELYRGPFLDGFYLSDAPDFERWVERDRAGFQRAHAEAVEGLATSAEAAGRWTDAVRWWRRLADGDPVSERYAIGVMRVLAGAGDRSAALRHADEYQATVERELGSGVGPEVTAFVTALRGSDGAVGASISPVVGRLPVFPSGAESSPSAAQHGDAPLTVRADAALAPERRTRWMFGVAGLVLLVAAIVLIVPRAVRHNSAHGWSGSTVEPSLGVLPLVNLGTDEGDAAFANGMTHELTAMLAKLGGLRVASSTSAFAFSGRSLDVRQVAESLRVTHILEGGLQRSGSRIRLQVRLVDARDGSTRWSEIYDRDVQDLFATQDALARAVARELQVRLLSDHPSGLVRHRTGSIAAYELYLRGRDPTLLRSDSAARVGLEYFSRAVAADSAYAAAWAGLAHMYGVLSLGGDPRVPRRALRDRALAAARQAVSLDDSLAEAHAELGFVLLAGLMDLDSAETELRRSLALDPAESKVHEYLAVLATLRGRLADALAEAREALRQDPLSPTASAEVARTLYLNGRCAEALGQLASLASVRPPVRRATAITGLCLAEQGRWPEAIATLRTGAEAGGPRALSLLASVLARSGQPQEASRILADLLARQQRNGDLAFEIAVVYASLSDRDRAFTWLDQAVDEGSLSPEIMGSTFRALRRDPRFGRLLQRLAEPERGRRRY